MQNDSFVSDRHQERMHISPPRRQFSYPANGYDWTDSLYPDCFHRLRKQFG
ncbi:hypothetical protein EV202_1366 [Bacteroides heparinolyticus]|uniref:Uncharacterized protein n=1 Tax=Prevotella heparinolytica TaxID=28113 RepID=A0A4V2SE56_9BACE|nr:hypothetical protein EV202_1366 [Bacteroides heparinolyticus]